MCVPRISKKARSRNTSDGYPFRTGDQNGSGHVVDPAAKFVDRIGARPPETECLASTFDYAGSGPNGNVTTFKLSAIPQPVAVVTDKRIERYGHFATPRKTPFDAKAECGLPRWSRPSQDPIPDIPCRVGIAGSKAEWVFADPAARYRVIPAGAVVLKARVRVVFARSEEITRQTRSPRLDLAKRRVDKMRCDRAPLRNSSTTYRGARPAWWLSSGSPDARLASHSDDVVPFNSFNHPSAVHLFQRLSIPFANQAVCTHADDPRAVGRDPPIASAKGLIP